MHVSAGTGGIKDRAIDWVAGRLPTCQAVTRIASESIDRTLTAREWVRKRFHFFFCVWCERYERQLRAMRSLAREGLPDVPAAPKLSDEARERLKRALRAEE